MFGLIGILTVGKSTLSSSQEVVGFGLSLFLLVFFDLDLATAQKTHGLSDPRVIGQPRALALAVCQVSFISMSEKLMSLLN
jgi:hypothetical protein